jgi:hypothetical protein
MKNEIILSIDIFTPATLSLSRMADYVKALSDILDHKDQTHFVRLDEGSARLVAQIDPTALPKVHQRLALINTLDAPTSLQSAYARMDDLLASDGAVGQILDGFGAEIIPFPGRTRPKPLMTRPVRQFGSLDGQVVRLGGADASSHLTLQDGNSIYSNIELTRAQAIQLKDLLYGPTIRIFGMGRWQRQLEGSWKLVDFKFDRFEILDDTPIDVLLTELRYSASNFLGSADAYEKLIDMRGEGEILH